MNAAYSVSTIHDFVGRELGVTDWVHVTQERVNAFADCTEDRQWIHVDVPRAKKESPFGGPVAHGMLTLSLLANWLLALPAVPKDAGVTVNYGFEKVRFLTPVPVGSRVRSRIKLQSATPKDKGRVLLSFEHTVEIENLPKPALIAEMLIMMMPLA